MFLISNFGKYIFFNDTSQAETDTEIKTNSWSPREGKILLTAL